MRQPLLTIAISTYNRVERLKRSLDRIREEIAKLEDLSEIEVLVVDNASTDETVYYLNNCNFSNLRIVRNSVNQGMLGNLNVCALRSTGSYIWCIGDDDMLIPNQLQHVLNHVRETKNSIVYLNYGHASNDQHEGNEFLSLPTRIKKTGVYSLFEAIQANSNLMTAIYALILRREQAIQCFSITSNAAPFTSLSACVPTTVFALSLNPETKVDWIAEPIVAVDLRVSWIRYAPIWIIERFSEIILEFVAWGNGAVNLDYVFEEMRPGIHHWLSSSLPPEYERASNFAFLKALINLYGNSSDIQLMQKLHNL